MSATEPKRHDFLNGIVHTFLDHDVSIILIVASVLVGVAALLVTAREEDPQIVVPLADVLVSMPGHSAAEVEQLAATPLEKILYQIDGVEYVYGMSRDDQAVITVRFYVGQDRERSLVKLFKKVNENLDAVPPGVTAWVVKPIEIDDVPVVTLTITGDEGDSYAPRRVGEEVVQRLSALPGVSRAYVVGGEARRVRVDVDPERLQAYALGPLEVQRALQGANVTRPAGAFAKGDAVIHVEAGLAVARPEELADLVVGIFRDRPVFLKDVATSATDPTRSPATSATAGAPRAGSRPRRASPAPRSARL
ncbi:MAG TPA: efflux RND transporter permease subunit [Isosphaeraceae bacterium]|jgi:multidrug efflux pump subunit AcrB|nr:efflux RND transporter permease subunit [Isosphaeraceae bacterium]